MHFTPPVQVVYALKQAIDEYFKEGEDAKFARHARVNRAIHKGIEQLGFEYVIDKEKESGLVVSVKYPDLPQWDFNKVHDFCYERGYTIYPGKISTTDTFRLCSLGAIDTIDIENFFVVFKEALDSIGIKTPMK